MCFVCFWLLLLFFCCVTIVVVTSFDLLYLMFVLNKHVSKASVTYTVSFNFRTLAVVAELRYYRGVYGMSVHCFAAAAQTTKYCPSRPFGAARPGRRAGPTPTVAGACRLGRQS